MMRTLLLLVAVMMMGSPWVCMIMLWLALLIRGFPWVCGGMMVMVMLIRGLPGVCMGMLVLMIVAVMEVRAWMLVWLVWRKCPELRLTTILPLKGKHTS